MTPFRDTTDILIAFPTQVRKVESFGNDLHLFLFTPETWLFFISSFAIIH